MLRPLEGIEKAFANPYISSNVQFSIKLENHNLVQKALNNFNKIFLGLRLKVVNDHYAQASDESIIGGNVKLPMWIQDCKAAGHWSNDNLRVPITDRLTTIASNDRMIVINTNHDVSDSGFIMNAVERCLNDDIMSVFTQDKDISKEEAMVPIPDSVAFKAEIERAERKKPKLHPNEICTSYPFDVNDELFVSQKPIQMHFDDELPIETLTCYDKKSKKPKQMNELIWTAITMNQNAMAKNIEGSYYKRQPLAIPTIVDTRRFADDQSKLNWRNTNCVTAVNLLADPTDDMKISDIFNLFRKDLNTHIKDDLFFWINNGSFPNQLGRAFGRNSGIGAVKIKRPVMDFFLQAVLDISDNMRFDHKSAVGLSLFSFTKVLPQKTVFCPTVYFQNSDSLLKETLVFKEAFRHFITEIPIDTNYKDALDELQSFQKNLLKNY